MRQRSLLVLWKLSQLRSAKLPHERPILVALMPWTASLTICVSRIVADAGQVDHFHFSAFRLLVPACYLARLRLKQEARCT